MTPRINELNAQIFPQPTDTQMTLSKAIENNDAAALTTLLNQGVDYIFLDKGTFLYHIPLPTSLAIMKADPECFKVLLTYGGLFCFASYSKIQYQLEQLDNQFPNQFKPYNNRKIEDNDRFLLMVKKNNDNFLIFNIKDLITCLWDKEVKFPQLKKMTEQFEKYAQWFDVALQNKNEYHYFFKNEREQAPIEKLSKIFKSASNTLHNQRSVRQLSILVSFLNKYDPLFKTLPREIKAEIAVTAANQPSDEEQVKLFQMALPKS